MDSRGLDGPVESCFEIRNEYALGIDLHVAVELGPFSDTGVMVPLDGCVNQR